jgi:hypothetical protein
MLCVGLILVSWQPGGRHSADAGHLAFFFPMGEWSVDGVFSMRFPWDLMMNDDFHGDLMVSS